MPFTNYTSLCRSKEVQDLIWSEIERVNANFARVETIKRFFLIEQQLTPEDEELTPTMKLKRSFVNTKYKDQIDAMYRPSAGWSGLIRQVRKSVVEETSSHAFVWRKSRPVERRVRPRRPAGDGAADQGHQPGHHARPRSCSAPIRTSPARSSRGACPSPTA